MGLRSLASSLDASLNVLSHGRRTAVPRHQALHAMLDWSFQLLPAVEKMVLRRLGVFNGPFTIEAARVVCSAHDAQTDAIEEALMNLVAKSLVSADVGGDYVRYRLLETTRAYAREMLEKAGERYQLDRCHAEYFRSLFEQPKRNGKLVPPQNGERRTPIKLAICAARSHGHIPALATPRLVSPLPWPPSRFGFCYPSSMMSQGCFASAGFARSSEFAGRSTAHETPCRTRLAAHG